MTVVATGIGGRRHIARPWMNPQPGEQSKPRPRRPTGGDDLDVPSFLRD